MKVYRVVTTATVVQYVKAYDESEAEDEAEQNVQDGLRDFWDVDFDSEVQEDEDARDYDD